MRLSENIRMMLENQWRFEIKNSFIYTQMRAWADYKGFNNIGCFYEKQANEEREHAEKIYSYIADKSDIMRVEPFSFDNPSPSFSAGDLYSIFQASLDVELRTTEALSAILDSAFAEKDFMSFDFMREMVQIQREEERTFQQLLDRMDRYPPSPSREFDLDLYVKETFLG